MKPKTRKSTLKKTSSPKDMEVQLTRLHYLPIVGFFTATVGILTCYLIAVSVGDVDPFLPFISDAGGDPPQSTIFSLSMIVVSFSLPAGVGIVFFINKKRNVKNLRLVNLLNYCSLVNAGCAGVGMLVLAVNPTGHLRRDGTWIKPVYIPHMVGAVFMFANAITLCVVLTVINFLNDYPNWRTSGFYLRLTVSVLAVISGITTAVTWPLTDMKLMIPSADHARHYPPGANVSTVSEWIVVLCFMTYTITYIREFKRSKITFKFDIGDENCINSSEDVPRVTYTDSKQ